MDTQTSKEQCKHSCYDFTFYRPCRINVGDIYLLCLRLLINNLLRLCISPLRLLHLPCCQFFSTKFAFRCPRIYRCTTLWTYIFCHNFFLLRFLCTRKLFLSEKFKSTLSPAHKIYGKQISLIKNFTPFFRILGKTCCRPVTDVHIHKHFPSDCFHTADKILLHLLYCYRMTNIPWILHFFKKEPGVRNPKSHLSKSTNSKLHIILGVY